MAERTVQALVVSPPTAVWGAQLYLLDQVDQLAQRGVALTLATSRSSAFATAWAEAGHDVLDLPLRRHEGLRVAGSDRRPGPRSLVRSAVGVIRGIIVIARVAPRYDMLYSFALRTHLEVAIAGRLRRTPTALDLVDIIRPGLGRRVLRLAARLADLTVANSTATASTVGTGPTVEIIHPGIDLTRFVPGEADPALRRELGGNRDAPLVAVIGRLDAKKGVHVLVDAMSQLTGPHRDATLIVVGEHGTGPRDYADRLRADAIAALGDRVRFLGRRADIPVILRSVDLLVVAADAEPFGLTALEAQACRTPVVGTDAGGLPEFVEHEVTGLLVPPGDATAMARAIERMLYDDELRASVIDEAYRRANPARGIPAQLDQIADMYRSVAGGST
jgi:glycosyltransferase involved in cell wall biosynthesis